MVHNQTYTLFLGLYLPHWSFPNIFIAFSTFSETPFPSQHPNGKDKSHLLFGAALYLGFYSTAPRTMERTSVKKKICQTYCGSRSLKGLEPEISLQLWFQGNTFAIIMKLFVNHLIEQTLQQAASSLDYRNVTDIKSKDYHLFTQS